MSEKLVAVITPIVILFVLLAGIWSLPKPTAPRIETYQIQSASPIMLMDGPSPFYESLGSLAPGAKVRILGSNHLGDWLEIESTAGQGWIPAETVLLAND